MTFFKLGLLAFVFLWGVGFQLGDWSNFTPFVERRASSAPLIGALAGGMIGAFFSFAGWWDLGKLAGDKESRAHLAKSTHLRCDRRHDRLRSDQLSIVYLVPLEQVTSGETFAAQAGEVCLGAPVD